MSVLGYDFNGISTSSTLVDEQPEFGLEGEVRDIDDMVIGRLYQWFNKDNGKGRSFELLGFPNEIDLVLIPKRPVERENDRVMRVKVRSEESEWAEGRIEDYFLTDSGLIPYENGWNPSNTVIEVADGKVYKVEDMSGSTVDELAQLEGVEAVVPTEQGAEVYTVLPPETEAFVEERDDVSVYERGYFNSAEMSIEPRDLDDTFEMLDNRASTEEVREAYRSKRNQYVNSAVERLSAGLIKGPLNVEEEYEEIRDVEDVEEFSFEDYEILSERLGTEVSADCARANLEGAMKAFKQQVEGLGTVFYGLSRRSGQLQVDRYLATPDMSDMSDYESDETVRGRELQVDILYDEDSSLF